MQPGNWKPDREVLPAEQLAREQLARHINAELAVIVATRKVWKPGEIMPQLESGYVAGGRFVQQTVYQPFVVRREVTFKDWLANTPPWIPGRLPNEAQAYGFRFFEVSTD
jgi:hypothetical protein